MNQAIIFYKDKEKTKSVLGYYDESELDIKENYNNELKKISVTIQ